MTATRLHIKNLTVSVSQKTVLQNFTLTAGAGELHALMGPNGAGKSTLAAVLMGHPAYTVESGSIELDGKDLLELATHERAKAGLFLAFQHPVGIPGLRVSEYLKTLYSIHTGTDISVRDFRKIVMARLEEVGLPKTVLSRDLNDSFSGGERKRLELVQLALVSPKLAILDEIDSGLDVDALTCVQKVVNDLKAKGTTFVVITHYRRLLETVAPDRVHLLLNGSIQQSGGMELADLIDRDGYQELRTQSDVQSTTKHS